MRISHGLMTGQVLQRNARGCARVRIEGTCSVDGVVERRVLRAGRTVRRLAWAAAGRADGKAFRAVLRDLPAGGPYRVELRVRQGTRVIAAGAVDEVFVGDVWILAGQSNMEGIGNLANAPRPHPLVRALYLRDEWAMAREKLHFLPEAVDPVHNGYGAGAGRPPRRELERMRRRLVKGVSPGLAFGLEMHRRTGVPQGLIPCAHGGTSMAQWSPALRDRGGASLYGAMMRRYQKLGQPIAGVLWYQGESDANPEAEPRYTDRMLELVDATRRDMGLARLPWLIVQLGCHAAPGGEWWNGIQEQQRRLPERIARLDVAPAVDLPLDDGIHLSGEGQAVLGRRLARLADRLVNRAAGAKPAVALGRIRLAPTPGTNRGCPWKSIAVTYRNVAGELVSAGRPTGFTLLDERGGEVHAPYKTTIEGSTVLLHTSLTPYQLAPLRLSYGHGRHPYCNITDTEGMSLPAMKAAPLNPQHARRCNHWQTARLAGARDLAAVRIADVAAARGWRAAPPRAPFGFRPLPEGAKQPGFFALRTVLVAEQALEAQLVFGSNLPFKAWLNGRPVLQDPAAQVPLDPARYRAALRLRRGANLLALAVAVPRRAPHFGFCASVGTREGKWEPRVTLPLPPWPAVAEPGKRASTSRKGTAR